MDCDEPCVMTHQAVGMGWRASSWGWLGAVSLAHAEVLNGMVAGASRVNKVNGLSAVSPRLSSAQQRHLTADCSEAGNKQAFNSRRGQASRIDLLLRRGSAICRGSAVCRGHARAAAAACRHAARAACCNYRPDRAKHHGGDQGRKQQHEAPLDGAAHARPGQAHVAGVVDWDGRERAAGAAEVWGVNLLVVSCEFECWRGIVVDERAEYITQLWLQGSLTNMSD